MKFPSLSLMLLLISYLISAEEVCKFSYKNDPAGLNNQRLELPHGSVAMSEFVHINNESSVIQTGGASSVFFIIDNSNSMFIKNNGSGGGIKGFDIDGARYSATKNLIDSIYAVSPESEVGLALFSTYLYFDTDDDPLFKPVIINKKIYDLRGGYIPLLKLNAVVNEGKYSGMTGYEALQSILTLKRFEGRKIKTYTGAYLDIPPYTNIEYEPSDYWLDPVKIKDVNGRAGTNIWGGFAAAKEAMINSSYSKENQHIIFYSDGSAMTFDNEAPRVWWEDSTAENSPTTYTVFFDENNSVAINSLTKLKNLIKGNNYSQSNIKSELWAMSAGHDVLLNLLMKNVINEIITNVTTIIPTDIKVKGVSPITSWDGDGFLFNSEFPLLGVTTPVEYSIEYCIVHDSIIGGDTITVPDKDTSINISYDVIVMDNPSTPDSCVLSWWGRSLSLKEDGADLTLIDNRKGVVDISFEEYKVDTLYDYSDVKIEITTENGDSETVVLSKSGNSHNYTIPREVGSANVGDGVIQYDGVDKLKFKFKNSLLPLDTLEKIIDVNSQGFYSVNGVIYKDNDGNGLIDKIKLDVSGDDLQSNSQGIVDNIVFPFERKIFVNSHSVIGDFIELNVVEQSNIIRTKIESFDIYTLGDTVTLSGDAVLAPFNLTAIDSIAPVVISASYIDSAKVGAIDLLTVVFSEKSNNVNQNSCLSFYENGTGSKIDVDFLFSKNDGLDAVYNILNNSIGAGDSLNINYVLSKKVVDDNGNKQDVENNRKVEIDVTVVEDRLCVLSASYYDDDANGWIDRVGLKLSKNVEEQYVNIVEQNLDFGTTRSLNIISNKYSNGVLELYVKETGSTKNTSTKNDSLKINDSIVISNDLILTPCKISVVDSMAPVVLSANLVDSVKEGASDFLTVSFSEDPLQYDNLTALSFYDGVSSNVYFEEIVAVLSNGNEVIYEFVNNNIKTDDSLNINSNNNEVIKDNKNNEQKNSDNCKVEIEISLVEANLYIVDCAYFDDNADGMIDKITVKLNCDINDDLVEKISSMIIFDSTRSIDIISQSCINNIITLNVKENSLNIKTSTINEVLTIKDSLKISEEHTLIPSLVSVKDSMAPVILEALLIDSVITEVKGKETYISERGEDFLIITFSEVIGNSEGRTPLKFKGVDEFGVALKHLNTNGDIVEYRILERNIISIGDSVSINNNNANSIEDDLGIIQSNNENRRCPVDIEIRELTSFVPAEVSFILKSTILEYDKKIQVPDNWNNENGKSGVDKNVMILMIEPDDKDNFTLMDDLIVSISIYDNLGNIILKNIDMKYDKERKAAHILWTGKNSNGRLVGSGMYTVLASVERYFDGSLIPVEAIRGIVGVKSNDK